MSSRTTLPQIIDSLTALGGSTRPSDFIYDFLGCFGAPKATIARLRSGSVNIAKKDAFTQAVGSDTAEFLRVAPVKKKKGAKA